MWLLLVLQLWTSTLSGKPDIFLEGNWQSCREEQGYGERIYERRHNGKFLWELHMGPMHDFALYHVPQPDEHDHTDDLNWLKEPTRTTNTRRVWDVPTLHLRVTAIEAGGSRVECESYFVVVEKLQ
jgi:hypothetical protein